MLPFLNHLRTFSVLSVAVRMLLAVLCGGVIGIEREYKRRPAGFRTHILVCLGAAMTTLINQYLYLELHYYTDMARLGAQVIAGIGFIGAGTIVVTRRQRVKGLTTAAGLWTCAIVGLTLGGGFYEAAITATALVLIAELVFSKLEYYILNNAPEISLYMEYHSRQCIDRALELFREKMIKVLNLEIVCSDRSEGHDACVIVSLRLSKKSTSGEIVRDLLSIPGVKSVEEI